MQLFRNKHKNLILFGFSPAYSYLCTDFALIGSICKWEKEKLSICAVGDCNW